MVMSDKQTQRFGRLGQWLLAGAVFLLMVWFFRRSLSKMLVILADDDNYSFAPLIPVVIGYIIYRKWPELRALDGRPSWWGLVLMAVGVVVAMVGEMVDIFYIPPLAFLIMLTGLLWLLGGLDFLRLISFPLFLLFILIPLPTMVLQDVSLRLQLISSRLAATMLNAMGYVVHVRGNVLDLGERQLQVVDACSGLGYLFNGLILGIIFCYFFQRTWWKALLLLLAVIPAAVVANASRVASIAIFPYLAEGFWHMAFGLSIFIVGFDYLRGVNWLLNRWQPPVPVGPRAPVAPPAAPAGPRPSWWPQLLGAFLLVVLMQPVLQRLAVAQPVPLLQSFDHFPLQLGDWQGRRSYVDEAIFRRLGRPEYVEAVYAKPGEGELSLWLAYYGSQKKLQGGGYHSPQYCLPGAGWKITHQEVIEVVPGKWVNYLVIEQAGAQQVVFYWFIKSGRWLASEYELRLYMGLDGLLQRRNDGALVRLMIPVQKDPAAARRQLEEFFQKLTEVLPRFLPG